jgi:hypothetical protein
MRGLCPLVLVAMTACAGARTAPPPAPQEEAPSEALASEAASPTSQRVLLERPETRVDERGDRVPVAFDLDGMIAAVERVDPRRVSARILAWMIEIDDRPLLIQSALLWLRVESPDGPTRFRLARVFRHPLNTPPGDKLWQLSEDDDGPRVGERSYRSSPTAAELELFLKATEWTFAATDGNYRVIDAEVCRNAWKELFGVEPEHEFPRERTPVR